jgi:hypothetical protein
MYDTDWFSRYISTLTTRTEMVLETLVFSPLNQLTRLVAREFSIIQSRRESYKLYNSRSVYQRRRKSEFGFSFSRTISLSDR